jgi:hypothetical protein
MVGGMDHPEHSAQGVAKAHNMDPCVLKGKGGSLPRPLDAETHTVMGLATHVPGTM